LAVLAIAAERVCLEVNGPWPAGLTLDMPAEESPHQVGYFAAIFPERKVAAVESVITKPAALHEWVILMKSLAETWLTR